MMKSNNLVTQKSTIFMYSVYQWRQPHKASTHSTWGGTKNALE